MWFEFDSPIPQQIQDSSEVFEMYSKYKLIPVYGRNTYSSNKLVEVLDSLSTVSPSLRACINDLNHYSFGNALDVQKIGIAGLVAEPAEVSQKEKETFANTLKANINLTFPEIIRVSRELLDCDTRQGNMYLQITALTVGGRIKGVKLKSIDQKNILYIANSSTALVTEYFDPSWWAKNPPEILPVSTLAETANWKKVGNDYTTVLHIATNASGQNFYGRPSILSVMDSLLAEYRTLVLNSKIASTETIAKLLLFFEEMPTDRQRGLSAETKQEQFSLRMAGIRELGTNEGKSPKSIVALEYPNDTNQPLVTPVQVNRDVAYAEFTLNNAASVIYAVLGWSKELTGQIQVKTGIGANILYDLFVIKNVSTIIPIQERFESIWHWVISEIYTLAGIETPFHGIKFQDNITVLVSKMTAVMEAQKSTTTISKVNNTTPIK